MMADIRGAYVYDPKSESERERIEARETKTRSRREALASAELSFTQLKGQLLAEGLIDLAAFEEGMKQLYSYYESDIFSVAFFFAGLARKPIGQST
jgi:hypothetical protein